MSHSEIYIEAKKFPFIFMMAMSAILGLLVVSLVFAVIDKLPLSLAIALICLGLYSIGLGAYIFFRLKNKKTGIRIKNGSIEDSSTIHSIHSVQMNNILGSKIKNVLGNECLLLELKDNMQVIKSAPILHRPYLYLLKFQHGSPMVFSSKSISKDIEELKTLIDERISK